MDRTSSLHGEGKVEKKQRQKGWFHLRAFPEFVTIDVDVLRSDMCHVYDMI